MKFSILLYGFYVLLRFTAWKDRSFREMVTDLDLSMAIRTADGKKTRHFIWSGGGLSTANGNGPKPDFSLIWKDADAGFRYMMKMKPKALMHAIKDGSLKLDGDAGKVTKFLEILKKMMECYGLARP